MRNLTTIIKALADENRLRIVAALSGRELCLCQLVELLGLAPSTVSRHVSLLEQAGLVASRKQGRWAYTRLVDDGNGAPRQAIALVLEAARTDKQARADAKQLAKILALNPEELCRRQGQRTC